MRGAAIVDELKKKFNIAQDNELADRLSCKPPNISQLRSNDDITPSRAITIMSTLAAYNLREKISLFRPIVEFLPVDRKDKGNSFINLKSSDRKDLQSVLKSTIGVFSFYNSEMEIIYVGKTKNNLWTEMISVYARKMGHYRRFYVAHAYNQYRPTPTGGVRKIAQRQFFLYDAAAYFSAYAISEEFIDIFETLVIRLIPNDLLNVRMEGNLSLTSFRPTRRIPRRRLA